MNSTEPSLTEEPFGSLPDGREVTRYTLRNRRGLTVRILNYGGILQEIHTPDRHGHFSDIVLGMKDLEGYLGHHPHYGAITGRFANRIANARFVLDGETYQPTPKKGETYSLHGGTNGFDKKLWKGKATREENDLLLELSYTSPDGEEGFPGKLETTVAYRLTDTDELQILYTATTDRPTVLNLTNHSYFNLDGQDTSNVGNHHIRINAPFYLPTDTDGIPTGEILDITGTAFDLRALTPVQKGLDANDLQITQVGGYDHTFVFPTREDPAEWDARVESPDSGRILEMRTTEPGVQFYTGNNLAQTELPGKNGKRPTQYQGLCLETQHFPDAPNRPHFPSTVLRKGEIFHSRTVYRFSTL